MNSGNDPPGVDTLVPARSAIRRNAAGEACVVLSSRPGDILRSECDGDEWLAGPRPPRITSVPDSGFITWSCWDDCFEGVEDGEDVS